MLNLMSDMQVLFDGMAQRQQQVVKAVIDYAQTRQIPVGGRLPSIRAIAEDTGIAPATITKALQHLARNGVVSSQGRHGTVLLQSMQNKERQQVQRIVIIYGLLGNVATSITGGHSDFEFRLALKTLRPDLEVYSILQSGREKDDYLEGMIRYHTQMGREGGVVFVLGNCDEKVKQLFQAQKVPTVVLGGREPGCALPNITIDIEAMVEGVFRLLEDGEAYPAVLIHDSSAISTEQQSIIKSFKRKAEEQNLPPEAFTVWNTSDSFELFRGQLGPLLREQTSVKTIITRADDVAMWTMRVCWELGLQKNVRLISMGGSLLGEWYLPAITGIHRDFPAIGQLVLELADALCNGEQLAHQSRSVKAVMVFRESFRNPYLCPDRAIP